MVLQCISRAN